MYIPHNSFTFIFIWTPLLLFFRLMIKQLMFSHQTQFRMFSSKIRSFKRLLRRFFKNTYFTWFFVRFVYGPTDLDQKSSLKTESFEDKNERLNRPLSPHLSIHKLQNNMILSISHRATGIILSGMLSGLALGTFLYKVLNRLN